jgi:hypothetical protein
LRAQTRSEYSPITVSGANNHRDRREHSPITPVYIGFWARTKALTSRPPEAAKRA